MSKILVAYFSASGVTAHVAELLAETVGADLYEIKPQIAYTDDDLNWMDKKSRSSVEMKDESFRPPLEDHDADIDNHEIIFVGFPIWWYRQPSIIDTFMEAYNFAGKKIIPFATSGGSGIGKAVENFKVLAPQAEIIEGRRFSSKVNSEDILQWFKSLNIK